MANEQEMAVSEAMEVQEVSKPRKLLRAVNPDLYEMFTERLEEMRIHSYDVQLIVEESEAKDDDKLVLKVLFGEAYDQSFEKVVLKDDLDVKSPEMETYLTELIAECEEALILDYRKFMQPHT